MQASHLPRVGTTELEALTNEEDITKGDVTNGLDSNIRETSTGPTVVKPEQSTFTPVLPVMVTAKLGPKHLQDPNISSSAAGTSANHHSPPPQQSRGAGGDKVKISLTFSTPLRSKLTTATPGNKRGTSHDTSGVGAKGTTKETITPPTRDSVDTDRPSNPGGGGFSPLMSKSDLPV